MIKSSTIVTTARRWLGVRWQHQGRTRHGVDCLGLVLVVAWELGLFHGDYVDYGRLPDGMRFRSLLRQHLEVTYSRVPGCVLLFRFERNPIHVGIATDKGVIHGYAGARRVVEHGIDTTWESRIVEIYRFGGMVDG